MPYGFWLDFMWKQLNLDEQKRQRAGWYRENKKNVPDEPQIHSILLMRHEKNATLHQGIKGPFD